MERIEYRDIVDRSRWSDGPWKDEPDKVQWQDEATSLPCLIVRGPIGALCGYVGVTEGHPCYGKQYGEDALDNLDVHGGITFGAPCQERDDHHGVCHIPGPGEPDSVWWLGFDSGHMGDLAPGMRGIRSLRCAEVYRDINYVTAECAALALQLKAMEAK